MATLHQLIYERIEKQESYLLANPVYNPRMPLLPCKCLDSRRSAQVQHCCPSLRSKQHIQCGM